MATVQSIREDYLRKGKNISQIAREQHVDRKTVKKFIERDDWNRSPEGGAPRSSVLARSRVSSTDGSRKTESADANSATPRNGSTNGCVKNTVSRDSRVPTARSRPTSPNGVASSIRKSMQRFPSSTGGEKHRQTSVGRTSSRTETSPIFWTWSQAVW